MAIAILAAAARGSGDAYNAANPAGDANKVPNINSFDLVSGSGSRVSNAGGSSGQRQYFLFDPLPGVAEFILPSGFEMEFTTRRAGGSTTGTCKTQIRNFDAGVRKDGFNFTGGLADNPMTQRIDIFETSADDSIWTPAKVNGIAAGWETVNQSTGINFFFLVLNVTWGAGGAGGFVDAVEWLGPLVAAGLGGLNLFSLRDDQLCALDRKVFRPIWRRAGLPWFPALAMRSEREHVLDRLFRRPVLVGG